MDHKALKSDLTYALKKLTKEGKTLTLDTFPQNLQFEDDKLVLVGNEVDALEALIFIKGYQYAPVKEVSKWVDEAGVEHTYVWWHHHAFGLPLCDLLSEQAQIAKTDLYEFMNGLENVAGNDKSEFYKVGVYIREKFTPVGARTETLQPSKYKEVTNVESVRRFIVYNRPMPGCRKTGAPSIVEVECEVFAPILAKEGEFAARILKPEFLWEPTRVLQDGVLKDVTLPPVYVSHAVYETLEQARGTAKEQVRGGLEFEVRKGKIPSYTDEEFQARCNLIQEVLMS